MLTQLPTLKARLAIPAIDIQYDDLLTNALTAISSRFDHETSRTLARTVNTTFEFGDDTEILPPATRSSPFPNSNSKPPKPKAGSNKPASPSSSAAPASFR